MENQHQKIKGYRELTPEEIALMNKVKAHGEASKALLNEVADHLDAQRRLAASTPPPEGTDELTRIKDTEPMRWMAMAKTDLQTGITKLVRAIAQPTTF